MKIPHGIDAISQHSRNNIKNRGPFSRTNERNTHTHTHHIRLKVIMIIGHEAAVHVWDESDRKRREGSYRFDGRRRSSQMTELTRGSMKEGRESS